MSKQLAIQLAGVSKAYPHFRLDSIDLQLEQGSIMGFIGPNGAGKSSTLRILMGLIRADQGEVRVLGHRVPDEQVAARWDIGFASEDMRLYQSRTLQWHMDFVKSIYPGWDDDYAAALARRFDTRPGQTLKGFSHGQRVKAGLLLVLARRPKLLLLDEPTTGLDPVARKEVLNELMDVLQDDGRSVLFSSHNTKDVEQVSDQITFIDRGRVIASQDKETFLERWRRVRFSAAENFAMPDLPDVVETRLNGRLGSVITGRFDTRITDGLQNAGATIQGVETMTLEEIFVTEVEASRAEVTGAAA